MSDLLIQAQTVNGMNDVVFTTGNMITILGGVIATVTTFVTLKVQAAAKEKADEKRFTDLETNLKEEVLSIKHGKTAMKKEMKEQIKEVDEHNRARIDKTQKEMRNYRDKTDEEFKQINSKMGVLTADTSEIKGMIQTLLSK